ncbi:MAG TPA: cellulase family glycosylhydrolase [Acidisarcina sp.]|nr:cellulase family glycosylhydrolase [Acidisarcina sp.]
MNVGKWIATFVVMAASASALAQQPGQQRWTEEKAAAWYARQPWLVGSNFVPQNAINELEMWQADTFDPAEIDKELGWAEGIGMNTMRVFLQDQLWTQDAPGFKSRINTFLEIAARHHIKPLFVLFDSCWESNPKLGPQHPPIPGVHNSGWVQSPGAKSLMDPSTYPHLKEYVQGVVGAFAKDDRILGWDIWNEPDNGNAGVNEPKNKTQLVEALLPQAFSWAREMHPTQPLTSGVWKGDWSHPDKESAMTKIQLAESDVISFHNYGWPEDFAAKVQELKSYHRPIICTEYMARGAGSTFDTILPIGKHENVAMINWGFVAGKSQTYLPWDSWKRPYVLTQPDVWFHDIFHEDGKPYRQQEIYLIHQLTGRGNVQPPSAMQGEK